MEIMQQIQSLYDKDTKTGYALLQKLEGISEQENSLYPFFSEFLAMLRSDRYVVRGRGFRLLCKQARWDEQNKINAAIDEILAAVQDDKPTAVRQALQCLHEVALYKKEVADRITEMVSSMDLTQFKESMRPLIEKDVRSLIAFIDEQRQNL